MPSTTSSSVSKLLASSTVITPSLPTFFIALAIIWPISVSPLAAIVATCEISSDDLIFLLRFLRSSTTVRIARSTPRLRSIGFMPAATDFPPSRTIAWASTQAVVVPSPATSLVFDATSRTIWAPMFSNLSSSSISLATVTPSLVVRGAPKDLSRMTLRPFGPSVTFTALARISTPRNMRSRASPPNFTSLAAILGISARGLSGEHAHDVGLLHDQEFVAIEFHFRARPLAEQHLVTGLELDGDQLAGLVATARTDGDDFALHRLFFGGIWDDDAALRLVIRVDALDDDTVMQGAKLQLCHGDLFRLGRRWAG